MKFIDVCKWAGGLSDASIVLLLPGRLMGTAFLLFFSSSLYRRRQRRLRLFSHLSVIQSLIDPSPFLSSLFIYIEYFFSRLDLFASSHWCEWGIAAGSSRVPVTLNSFRLNWGFDSIRWLVALCFADEALSRPNQFKLIAVNFRFDFNWQFGLDHPLAPPLCSISHLSPAPLLLLLNHFKEKQLSIEFRGRGCG